MVYMIFLLRNWDDWRFGFFWGFFCFGGGAGAKARGKQEVLTYNDPAASTFHSLREERRFICRLPYLWSSQLQHGGEVESTR